MLFFSRRNIENYPFCLEHRCHERYICVKHTQTLLLRLFLTLTLIAVFKKTVQLL